MKSKTLVVFLLAAAFALAPAVAGVVYQIEVKDHQQSPPRTESIEAVVEGRNLKMGVAPGREGGKGGDMIYRGDRREVVVVDHDEKSYVVMDQESMGRLAGQVASSMNQMQEALKNVPESERRKIEEMMKQRMPSAAQSPRRPNSELKKTGEKATHAGYPCVKYEVLRGGKKIRELWVTDWSNVEGGEEVADTFEDMADFLEEFMDAIPDFGQGGPAGDPAFEHMREIGGFPVVTREFDEYDGSLEDESTLRSARRRALDPDAFEPPSGYKRRSMLGAS